MSTRECCDVCDEEISIKNNRGMGHFKFTKERITFGVRTYSKQFELCDDCYLKFIQFVKMNNNHSPEDQEID